jgi:hypothetical protein
MIELFPIVLLIVTLSLLLLGVNILILGRKFPETEVGRNRHMIRLGLRCPHCEEKAMLRKKHPSRINPSLLKPDWQALSLTPR